MNANGLPLPEHFDQNSGGGWAPGVLIDLPQEAFDVSAEVKSPNDWADAIDILYSIRYRRENRNG
jgi:hypothetical protein